MEDKLYTFSQLGEKYGWNYMGVSAKQMEKFAKAHGVEIELVKGLYKTKKVFRIISDDIANYNWVTCALTEKYEVCKEGLIRNKKNKRIYSAVHQGYIYIIDRENNCAFAGHRMIMETFNPIENSQDYVVDHINGKKTDNRLENLRWTSCKGNALYKWENWDKIASPLQELLQLVGYEELIKILKSQIKKYK